MRFTLPSLIRIALICVALSGCGSDFFQEPAPGTQPQITEAGNPPVNKPKKLRSIFGRVPAGANPALGPCQATQAVATDTAGLERKVDITPSCFFEIRIQSEKAWAFRFELAGGGSAFLEFENGPNYFIPAYYVSDEVSPVYLGLVSFQGNEALAEREATRQSDRDSDGHNDYDDPDDDNDGIDDLDEADCDGDGIIDDDELAPTC